MRDGSLFVLTDRQALDFSRLWAELVAQCGADLRIAANMPPVAWSEEVPRPRTRADRIRGAWYEARHRLDRASKALRGIEDEEDW